MTRHCAHFLVPVPYGAPFSDTRLRLAHRASALSLIDRPIATSGLVTPRVAPAMRAFTASGDFVWTRLCGGVA